MASDGNAPHSSPCVSRDQLSSKIIPTMSLSQIYPGGMSGGLEFCWGSDLRTQPPWPFNGVVGI